MAERILVVEDAFVTRGKGILVEPRFTTASPRKGPFPVRLRFADGTTRDVTAELEVAHMRGPLPPFAMVRLHDLVPEDVPAGTELWSID